MVAEIKTKEFDISIDDQPKMARVGDYWSDKQTMEIMDLLKQYQYDFSRNCKDLKILLQEMGEMQIKIIHGTKIVKKMTI
jgi:hypothetical protein